MVGEKWSARAHELRDLLARNKVLYGFLPADSDQGRALLERLGATTEQLPVVVTFDGLVLRDPSFAEVAEALSAPTRPAAAAYDVTVVGAGPAGLAAAMYGAPEGLGTALLEPEATGGQAGTTSMIRNYLGFPTASAAPSWPTGPSTRPSASAPTSSTAIGRSACTPPDRLGGELGAR